MRRRGFITLIGGATSRMAGVLWLLSDPSVLRELKQWIRQHLRSIVWRQPPAPLIPPNRRLRTRRYGGVGGVES
jgi:hypothetical protein